MSKDVELQRRAIEELEAEGHASSHVYETGARMRIIEARDRLEAVDEIAELLSMVLMELSWLSDGDGGKVISSAQHSALQKRLSEARAKLRLKK